MKMVMLFMLALMLGVQSGVACNPIPAGTQLNMEGCEQPMAPVDTHQHDQASPGVCAASCALPAKPALPIIGFRPAWDGLPPTRAMDGLAVKPPSPPPRDHLRKPQFNSV